MTELDLTAGTETDGLADELSDEALDRLSPLRACGGGTWASGACGRQTPRDEPPIR